MSHPLSRRTACLVVPLLLSLPGHADAFLSRADARNIALTQVINGSTTQATLFAYLYRTTSADSVLRGGEAAVSGDRAHSVNFVAPAPTYFVYIDDHPMLQYEHKVRYVFIDATSGAKTVLFANGLPHVGADYPYALGQERFESPDLFYGDFTPYLMHAPPPVPAKNLPRLPGIFAGGTCGIIVKGPAEPGEDAGADSAKAAAVREATGIMQGKGVAMISCVSPTTGSGMGHELAMAGKGKDKLWVYYIGHGWIDDGGDTGPAFPGAGSDAEEFPTWKAMACSLAMSGVKNICVILDCCHAGGAIAQFQMKGIPGVIATACATDSFAYWWAMTNAQGKIVSAVEHYTHSLAACFASPAADMDMPPNGVDLKEAHAWARKDTTVAKQKPPDIGILTRLDVRSAGSFTIPGSLANPSLYGAQGMASDQQGRNVYCLFTPFDPQRPSLITITHPGTPNPPSFLYCSVAPRDPIPPTDACGGLTPNQFCLTDGPQVYLTQGCSPGLTTSIRPYDGLMHDPNSPLVWGAFGQVSQDGPRSFADQISIATGPPQFTGITAEIIHTMRPGGATIQVRDMDKTPLGTYNTQGFYDVIYTLGQTSRPSVEFHTLASDQLSGYRFLNMGTSLLNETPQAAGLASLPAAQSSAPRLAPAWAAVDSFPVTLYVLDAVPQAGNWRVLQYTVLGLTTSGEVGVPPSSRPGMSLLPPRPSPARGSSLLAFALDVGERVQLAVYDARGRLVRVMHDGEASAGPHEILWDGRTANGARAPAGVYVVQLTAREGGAHASATRRLVLLQ
jgi:hypothetical protein